MEDVEKHATLIQMIGAGGFGALIGWYLYYINRHRKSEVQLSDLVTVIAAVGGAGITSLFGARTDLFGAYGVGLFAGFFGYFLMLLILVGISKQFSIDFFLDGRRKKPADPYYIPTEGAAAAAAMSADPNKGREPNV